VGILSVENSAGTIVVRLGAIRNCRPTERPCLIRVSEAVGRTIVPIRVASENFGGIVTQQDDEKRLRLRPRNFEQCLSMQKNYLMCGWRTPIASMSRSWLGPLAKFPMLGNSDALARLRSASTLIFPITVAPRRLAVNDNGSLSVFSISLNDCNHLRRFKSFLFD
jgi:hypothetical protein